MCLELTIGEAKLSEEPMPDTNLTMGLPQDLAVRVLKAATIVVLLEVPIVARVTTTVSSLSLGLTWPKTCSKI